MRYHYALFAALAGAAVAEPVSFNRDIRPIMADTCFRCHGPDHSSRMANMRLDLREEALKPNRAGVAPIVPGDPEQSGIIQRVFATNPARLMPPKSAHKDLTTAQKEVLRRWVAEGANYEGHWAYVPVSRPKPPEVAGVENPIDAFIRARLEKEGLPPSPQADPRSLIRRVTLDLTGLPPKAEDVEAFAKDPSDLAYRVYVDRLLGSERYAEKQAMHWLDAVRYADTSGFHGDQELPAWPYRDYVLRAFRDNMPFDRFTREQLAGDLMPNATLDQKVASAYNRMNRTSSEGGLQPKEYLAKYASDRVRTLSIVWLGATTGCAECHDHKFDPIRSKDFYAMKAFFADIKETGLVPDRGPKAWGSKLSLATDEQQRRLRNFEDRIESANRLLSDRISAMEAQRSAWETTVLAEHQAGRLAWQYQRPVAAKATQATLTIFNDQMVEANFYVVDRSGASLASERYRGDGLIVAGGANPDKETYEITLKPGAGEWRALGVEAVQDESLPAVRLARGADRFLLTEVEAELRDVGRAPEKLQFVLANADPSGQPADAHPMAAIDGDSTTGWGVSHGEGRSPFLALRLSKPVRTTATSRVVIRLRHDSEYRRATIGRFRLALSNGQFSWPEGMDAAAKSKARKPGEGILNGTPDRGIAENVRKALAAAAAERTPEQKKLIDQFFAWTNPSLEPLVVELARLEAEKGRYESSIPQVVYTEPVEPRETRVLSRGNWMDETGEIVEPAIPGFLGALQLEGRRANRLDLANWIVAKDNPLTARVYVNRQWRIFFGTGLSKVLEDLGSQGEWPSHPALLDWLAAEFMEPQYDATNTVCWDTRHLVRTIVMSRTYRQSSRSNPQLEQKDPDNRLLARQSRYRLDAEVVHDVALAASGLLVEQFGGPSVRPYQPDGYLLAMNFPKRDYSASHGEGLYRRGLYTHWQRTFLHPSLLAFDASTREECTVNRTNSNTPLQALVLLNDPIFVEAARAFAQRMRVAGGGTAVQQIEWAFEQAVSRLPSDAERAVLLQLYRQSRARFQASPASARQLISTGEAPVDRAANPVELAALTTVARAILNMHETVTRN